ncbi:MAG: hypothetical protein K2Z80_18155 [Xanthobacteraceae bacterium]|nr:hypothetical protein [Xanthobacteraceae bacterium]
MRNREIASALGYLELADIFKLAVVDEAGATAQMVNVLANLGPKRVDEIRKSFFDQEKIAAQFPTNELSDEAVDRVCSALHLPPENRWTFDSATDAISAMKVGSDEGTT